MPCCGQKKKFKSKVAIATQIKREYAKVGEVVQTRDGKNIPLGEATNVDGIPFSTLPNDVLTPRQLRIKNRAIRVKRRNELQKANSDRESNRQKRVAQKKASEAKLKNIK